MTLFKNKGEARVRELSTCLITVKRCFFLPDPNEEFPLYILQIQDGTILVLFGQWLFDPHTLIAPERTFEQWKETESFFADFSLKYDEETGGVFELRVKGDSFIRAEHLQGPLRFTHLRECEFIKRTGKDLIHALQDGGLLQPDCTENGGLS